MGSRPARTLSQGERNVFLNECGREWSGDSAGMTLETGLCGVGFLLLHLGSWMERK